MIGSVPQFRESHVVHVLRKISYELYQLVSCSLAPVYQYLSVLAPLSNEMESGSGGDTPRRLAARNLGATRCTPFADDQLIQVARSHQFRASHTSTADMNGLLNGSP